jgi:RNA recognition motif-containing protein
MNGRNILKNKIKVFSKEKYKQIDKEANVFFSKLPKQMSVKEFEEMVGKIGNIFSIKFNDLENEDFNTAYVQYENIGDAKNAIGILNNEEYYG